MRYQTWPKVGPLAENMNKTLQELKETIGVDGGITYTYVCKTFVRKPRDNSIEFYQDSCTPNFEGGLLTYTACRRDIQARNTAKKWKGEWLAGFTSKTRHEDHYLAFLMKVSEAYNSFAEIWANLDSSIRSAKNARFHRLGDLYEPKFKELKSEWDPRNYYTPIKGHVHLEEDLWFKDVTYFHKAWKRRACQLVGDPANSYLWNEPIIRRRRPFSSARAGKKYDDLKGFIADLCSS